MCSWGNRSPSVLGNRRELPVVEIRDRLFKRGGIDVGVIRAAPIARPPTGVYRQLHQVRKPRLSAGSRRNAALQRAEGLHVHGFGPLGHQICVDKVLVADLVVGDVMNVLRDVAINVPQPFGVGPIPTSTRHLAVLDSAQFVILSVKVSLECFSRGQKSQDGGITSVRLPLEGVPWPMAPASRPLPMVAAPPSANPVFRKLRRFLALAHHAVIGLHVVPPSQDSSWFQRDDFDAF